MSIVGFTNSNDNGAYDTVYFETESNGDGVIRPAGADASSATNQKMEGVLKALTDTARQIMSALEAANPDEMTVQFGVKISAELGLPFISKGTADSNINVTMKWAKKPGSGS